MRLYSHRAFVTSALVLLVTQSGCSAQGDEERSLPLTGYTKGDSPSPSLQQIKSATDDAAIAARRDSDPVLNGSVANAPGAIQASSPKR